MPVLPISKEDAINICKLGQGADCCVWLVTGTEGFECLYNRKSEGRNLVGETLEELWKRGLTVAKRDGCERMKTLFPEQATRKEEK